MRILIISIYYQPEPVPKPGELARGLARRGHGVTVLTGFPTYPAGRRHPGCERGWIRLERADATRVIRLPTFPDRSDKAWRRSMHYLVFAAGALLLGGLLCGPQDIVYVWGNPPTSGLAGYIIARLRRAKFVYGIHDLWPDLALASGMVKEGLSARLIRRLERFLWRRADLILPVSEGFRSVIVGEIGRTDRVVTLPHWADASLYRPVEPDPATLAELGTRDKSVTILYAGNLGKLQGLENLIEAAALLRESEPTLRVLLAGSGIAEPALEEAAARTGATNVTFLGTVPPQRVVELSAAADALYVGLLSNGMAELAVPSKVITYLACGRPILCNVPGETSRIVAEASAGIRCAENTPQGIADAIKRFLALTAAERSAMGQRAHTLFGRAYEMEMLLDRHEAMMAALLDASASA